MQCDARTRKGARCLRSTMKNSEVCYIHSFGTARGVPLWRRGSLHLTIMLFLLSPAYSRLFQRTFEEKIQFADETYQAALLRRYPSGYVIFGATHNEVQFPRQHLVRDYGINWETAKVEFVTSDSVGMILPDITYEDFIFSGNRACVQGRLQFRSYPVPVDGLPDKMYFEFLNDSDERVIVVLGFAPDPNWQGSMNYIAM